MLLINNHKKLRTLYHSFIFQASIFFSEETAIMSFWELDFSGGDKNFTQFFCCPLPFPLSVIKPSLEYCEPGSADVCRLGSLFYNSDR